MALIVLVLFGSVGAAVYLLRVAEVRVTGVRTLSARTIIEASGLEPGDRILWVRMSAAERRIEKIPAVADAVAERSLPGTVVIHIRERVPLARLDGARELVVDAQGLVFGSGEQAVKPVLYGWKGRSRPGASVNEPARLALSAYERFPALLQEWTRRIAVGPTMTLTLLGGTEIRFGFLRDLDTKARVAEGILRAERGHPLDYVDVRSAASPVSRRRDAPTPTPTSPSVAETVAPSTPTPTPTPGP